MARFDGACERRRERMRGATGEKRGREGERERERERVRTEKETAARWRRNDKRGQENNNKETRRQDNVRRRAGVHSCFLLVSWLNLRDRPVSSLTLPHLPRFLPPFPSFSLSSSVATTHPIQRPVAVLTIFHRFELHICVSN